MGRLYLLIACALACVVASMTLAVPARGSGDQPMKWSKHQWRSDLFDSYPLRPRHRRVHILRQEVEVRILREAPALMVAPKVAPRLLVLRHGRVLAPGALRAPTAAAPAARCAGVLVLTWDGHRARRACERPSGSRLVRVSRP